MLIAERRELVFRAADVQGTGGFQGRHEDPLFRAQNLGGLAHEAHAGHDQGAGRVVAAEARHFQGIGHAAAGLLGQGLDLGVGVIVGHHHGVTGL